MSRRRYVSTDISIDTAVNRLATIAGDFAAMLYTWMIPHAADDASLPADPEKLMFMVIPGRRDKTPNDVAYALTAMRDEGLIIWEGDDLHFPPAAFYKYQTYIQQGKRRGANQDCAPEEPQISANQRKSAQNASSPSVKPSPSPSPLSPNGDIADKPQRSAKRAAQIPQPFEITEEMYTWAEQKGISERLVHSESEKFVNYYLGNGRPMKDWCATWENWLLRAIENQAQGRWTGTQMHR